MNKPPVICDKCDLPVEPWDNTRIYDAAFQAGGGPETITIVGFVDVPLFQHGEVVHGKPRTSMLNVLHSSAHQSSRHFHASGTCEGSPSRRMNVEEGIWPSGRPLRDGETQASRVAYDLMTNLKEELGTVTE